MDNWRKFWHLSWLERWLLLQALLILPITGLILRLLGFKRCQSIMVRLSPLRDAPVQTDILSQRARKIARVVRVAAWYGPYSGKCLEQSLVLWYLLRRQLIKSDLRIGARKDGSRFEAHAWVEFLGIPLNENKSVYQHFTPFDCAIRPMEPRTQ